jgi:peroxiredoxin
MEANNRDRTKTSGHRSVVGERIRSEKINLRQKLAGRRVAIFGMPGAFSTKCSGLHLPKIMGNKNELMKKGRGCRYDRFAAHHKFIRGIKILEGPLY